MHTIVAYIVDVIIQVLSVLAPCVDLGEDLGHQVALGIGPSGLLGWMSRRGLEEL